MQNFRAALGQCVGVVVTHFVQQLSFLIFAGVGGKDAVDIGPDDQFVGVHNVSDDGAGKIGAVAAQGGDATVGRSANKTGYDRDEAVGQQRKKNFATAHARFCQVRARVAEGFAGAHKVGGGDGNRGNIGLLQR